MTFKRLKTLRRRSHAYTDAMIENAKADLERQLDPAAEGVKEFLNAIRRPRCGNFMGIRAVLPMP